MDSFSSKIAFTLFSPLRLTVIVIMFLASQIATQVVWSNYPDIAVGLVKVYTGATMVNTMTPAATFTQPFTLSSTANPVAGSIGICSFQIPETHDFSLLTNKSITTTAFTFRVQVYDESAFHLLWMNYIVMFDNNVVYKLISHQLYCTNMSTGIGFRSEYDIIQTADPFFNRIDIESTMVLQGFSLINAQGSFTFISSFINLPKPGVINTTFFTYEQNKIIFLQYTLILYNRDIAYLGMRQIFDIGYANFTFNYTIVLSFFNAIDSRYTASPGRMFFGLREFNFTYLSNKDFRLDTSMYNNLIGGYTFTKDTLVRIRVSYFFFVDRSCQPSTYFYKNPTSSSLDDCFASCSGFTDRPVADPTNKMCLPCDYTCLTCTSTTSNSCLSCEADNFRALNVNSCPCLSGYIDQGAANCAPCWTYMSGCDTCTSTTACTSCRAGFSGTTTCSCSTGSIVGAYCNTIYGCTSISELTGTPLCTSCNQSLLLVISAAFTCVCMNGTTTLANLSCQTNCGDGYVLSYEGCDDGNTMDGDGCSSACKVEKYWSCVGMYAQGSTCKIYVVQNLEYIGMQRITSKNTAILYFTLTPYFPQFAYIDWTNLLSNHDYSFSVEFLTDEKIMAATVDYSTDLEGTYQSFIVYLNKTKYFWNNSDSSAFLLKGVNCEITYDNALWVHNVLQYVYLTMVLLALIIFIASIFFQKWIGLELIQTFQSIYFICSLMQEYPFEFSGLYQTFKYSTGYDDIIPNNYYRTYTLSQHLNALAIQKQFLSNFNLMYIIITVTIAALIIIGLVKRHYRIALEQQKSIETTRKLKKSDKIYTFVFGKVFIMVILFSMFKIIFCFCVQLNHEKEVVQIFKDEFNVTAAILAFILVFSVISYILYWFLLLPNNYTEDQEFMSLNFQNMSFYYPMVYINYNAIFILIISIVYNQSFTPYLLLTLQIIYLLFLIFARPYNTLRMINRSLHNISIIINQATSLTFLCIIIRWNSILGGNYQSQSNYELTVYCFLILAMLTLCIALTILRLYTFNREVNLKCCKKQQTDEIEELDYNSMKKIANQSKLNTNNESAQDKILISQNEASLLTEQKKRKVYTQEIEIDQQKVNKYLNENYVNWAPSNRKEAANKSIIKSSTSKKKATLKKSPLETYIELKKKSAESENNK